MLTTMVARVLCRFAGFACWLVDRLACDLISPHLQLHAMWHIFIAAAAQYALVLSILTHELEKKGRISIGSWYGLSYLKSSKERAE